MNRLTPLSSYTINVLKKIINNAQRNVEITKKTQDIESLIGWLYISIQCQQVVNENTILSLKFNKYAKEELNCYITHNKLSKKELNAILKDLDLAGYI